MSFDSNPYREMTVAQDNEGNLHWLCRSCGGISKDGAYPENTLAELWSDWEDHVRDSHALTPEHVANWWHPFS